MTGSHFGVLRAHPSVARVIRDELTVLLPIAARTDANNCSGAAIFNLSRGESRRRGQDTPSALLS